MVKKPQDPSYTRGQEVLEDDGVGPIINPFITPEKLNTEERFRFLSQLEGTGYNVGRLLVVLSPDVAEAYLLQNGQETKEQKRKRLARQYHLELIRRLAKELQALFAALMYTEKYVDQVHKEIKKRLDKMTPEDRKKFAPEEEKLNRLKNILGKQRKTLESYPKPDLEKRSGIVDKVRNVYDEVETVKNRFFEKIHLSTARRVTASTATTAKKAGIGSALFSAGQALIDRVKNAQEKLQHYSKSRPGDHAKKAYDHPFGYPVDFIYVNGKNDTPDTKGNTPNPIVTVQVRTPQNASQNSKSKTNTPEAPAHKDVTNE